LLESVDIALEITNLLGNVVYSISNFYDAIEHFIILDTKEFLNGSYICRMLIKGKQLGITNFIVVK
jgi:hypothetical protein